MSKHILQHRWAGLGAQVAKAIPTKALGPLLVQGRANVGAKNQKVFVQGQERRWDDLRTSNVDVQVETAQPGMW